MVFDFIKNIEICFSYRAEAPLTLIYYSHLPVILLSVFIGFFVLLKNRKSLLNRLLFSLSLIFSLWVALDFNIWNWGYDSILTMISWSFFLQTSVLIAILCFYFFYVFLLNKNINLKYRILLFSPFVVVTLLAPTTLNLINFDLVSCEAKENIFNIYYYFASGGLAIIGILLLVLFNWKNVDKKSKKEILLMATGLELFLILFYSLSAISSYLENYNIEFYGLFGMVIFITFLSYLIVKFKTFDIKLIGSQALVWALIILIGSQFFFIQTNINRVLTAITLVLAAIMGLIIVRSVKKEIAQKEYIEKIADELKIANTGQENLIHIMNHQVKGFFGIAKNIFAELLEGDDYGHMPNESRPMLEKGLESTSTGVNYVQDILKGFNAEKGLLSFNKNPINIKDIVLKLLSEQKDIATKKGLKFESNIEDGDYNIIGDGSQLREAFKNLITNAIKYNDYNYSERGIKINLVSKNKKIVFAVKDTGIGISEEDKPNLFKAGGMGKNSLKFNADSSGFGLSTVKGIIEAHKGTVGYKSNAPEKGTTFFIELPLDQSSRA